MMQLTFGRKLIGGWWMTMMVMLMTILSAISCATVDGWQHDSDAAVIIPAGENCRLRNGDPGVCKLIETCQPYAEGLRKKTIAYNSLVRCSFVGINEVICCPSSDTPTPTTPTKTGESPMTTADTVATRNQNERPSQAACRRFSEFNPASLTFHILDGVPVNPGDYPHMGGMIYPLGGGSDIDVRCGSSLISERYALTAAHCVNDPLSLPTMVRLGVVIWNSTENDIVPVDVEIENITIHPEYLSHLRYHDIALIQLKKNVDFTPFIRPACLYADMKDIDSATPLVVIGWGVTNVQTRARSEILLMTNVTTVPLQECNATHIAYGVSRSYKNGLNEGHYCAFDPELKKDACQSDSGGPLQLVDNKSSTIVGIVSFGLSCGSAVPSVYARVAFYLDWIESIVWPT